MRVYIFNLKAFGAVKRVCKSLLAVLIVLSIAVYLIGWYKGSDAYSNVCALLNERKTLIIDAGHGGEDCGTIGINGVYEKDLNLSIASLLGSMAEEEGYAVVYTRTDDKLLYTEDENVHGIRKLCDLKNRCKIAAEYQNAVFVSIHMNSFSSPKYSGLQVYYSTKNEDSRALAHSVQESVKSDLQATNNRNIKKGEGIYVLENMENPAILIECGFLSNPDECERLSEKEYQKSLSFSILCGIIEYNDNRMSVR